MPDFFRKPISSLCKTVGKVVIVPPLPEKNASFLGVTCETRASLLGTGHDHAPRALYPVFVDVSIRFPAYR